jgi:putative addiction module CopG family antidote
VQVVLPPDLERFVAAKVASGEYPVPALVIHAALQELRARGMTKTDRRAELEADIVKGLESGPGIEASDGFWEHRRRTIRTQAPQARIARTRELPLPRKLNEFIDEQITSGRHQTPTEVICEALRLLDKPFRFADEAATEGPGR